MSVARVIPIPLRPRAARTLQLALQFVLLLAAMTASGCAAPREAELLGVSAVEPERLEPGRDLVVSGTGFPPGRDARVRLEGLLHQPGRRPRRARVEIAGRAVSAERVEARFTREALAQLDGRGTLRGRVSVLFRAASRDQGDVVGRSASLVLDITPASTDRLDDELARLRAGNALVQQLGLTLDEESPDEAGLPVAIVAAGSVAARAGLVPGDRVVELDGVRAHTVADLVPRPGDEHTRLTVARLGESAPFEVRLPLGDHVEGVRTETVRVARAALGWVLLVLLFLAPTAGVVDWLAHGARRVRSSSRTRGPTSPPAPEGPTPRRARLLAFARRLPPLLVATACVALVPALDHAGMLVVPLEVLLIGGLAVRVSAAWLASTSRTGLSRALALAHAAFGVALVTSGLLGAAAFGGTTDLSALADQQGAPPWTWTLFRTPMGPLLLGAVLLGASIAPPDLARGALAHSRIARLIDDALLLAVAASGAAVLLGGWGGSTLGAGGALTPEVLSNGARSAGALLYVVLTVAAWSWMRRARRRAHATRASMAAAALLGVLALAGSALRIVWEPPAELEAGLAQAAGAGVVVLLLAVLARLLTRPGASGPLPAHRFL